MTKLMNCQNIIYKMTKLINCQNIIDKMTKLTVIDNFTLSNKIMD